MAISRKYGQINVENSDIGENEPVVVFRAKDRLLPKVLKIYRIMCELAGSPSHHLELLDSTAAEVKVWQSENPTRTPNSARYAKMDEDPK